MGRGFSAREGGHRGRRARTLVATLAAVLVAGLLAAAPAGALDYPTGWNGQNPFTCDVQDVGFGTAFPHPDADPFCVEFDKRRQNVTELGVVDFLSQEPARVAAASTKCFYFQSDHWRGSIVQGDPSTKTYEWDGHYFFDKARGEGGVWVSNFNFNGRTFDPSSLPGMPSEYARYFGPGTGGVITRNEVQADPSCIEKAKTQPPYAKPAPGARGCLAAKGTIGSRQIAGVSLGESEARVRGALGPPHLVRRGFLRWCYQDGSSLRAGNAADRSGDFGAGDSDPTRVVLVTNRGFTVRGIGPGASVRVLRRAFRGARRRFSVNGKAVWTLARTGRLVAGVRRGRVAYLALYDRGTIRSLRTLKSWLRRGG
jgi:hypothetical protein